MKLYFVRHGESEGNRDNKFRGRADYPLTDAGRQQAESAGIFLKETVFEKVYSSPLKRALETAEIISRHTGNRVECREELNNIFLGEWEDKPKMLIKEKYPKEWETWVTNPEKLYIESMENLDHVRERTVSFAESLKEIHKGNILIVTHRAVLKPLISGLINIETPYFWKLHIDTASVSIVEWLNDGRGWMLKSLNTNHYLKGFTEELF